MIPFLFLSQFLLFAACAYVINVTDFNNLQSFDGIGAVSGGGATSKLLFTYFPTENDRKPLLDVLFNNETGLEILKVEMGGDDQSTEGSESSHMSQDGQISWNNYEFQLIREALMVNSNLKICALPWAFPGWIGKTPYDNYSKTARYVVEWLKIARKLYGFEVYCVGIWNERNFSEPYVKVLRKTMNEEGFKNTKIVAGEGFQMDESYPRLLDKDLIDSYDIIGVHYPGGKIPSIVQRSGKTIWASEDFSTDNRKTGEGCMARVLNWNYVRGNITGMISWHLTSAFYPQISWYRCGLSYLDETHFTTEVSFKVLQYLIGHVRRGWKILPHGQGSGNLAGGGTYVTYTNGKDYTIFMEAMSLEKSVCEYSNPQRYSIPSKQVAIFELSDKLRSLSGFNMSFNYDAPKFIKNRNGRIEITVLKDSFGILTTLPIRLPSQLRIPIPPLPVKYFDDFSRYSFGEEPRYWMPQKGSWEVRNKVAVQKVIQPPISWCTSEIRTPYAVMSFRKQNTMISGQVLIPFGSNATSSIIGLRSNCSGCDIGVTNCRGIFTEYIFETGKIRVFSDFVKRTIIGKLDAGKSLEYDIFHDISMKLSGNDLYITINNKVMSLSIPRSVISKTINDTLFVIGTGNFGISYWDNLEVS